MTKLTNNRQYVKKYQQNTKTKTHKNNQVEEPSNGAYTTDMEMQSSSSLAMCKVDFQKILQ